MFAVTRHVTSCRSHVLTSGAIIWTQRFCYHTIHIHLQANLRGTKVNHHLSNFRETRCCFILESWLDIILTTESMIFQVYMPTHTACYNSTYSWTVKLDKMVYKPINSPADVNQKELSPKSKRSTKHNFKIQYTSIDSDNGTSDGTQLWPATSRKSNCSTMAHKSELLQIRRRSCITCFSSTTSSFDADLSSNRVFFK